MLKLLTLSLWRTVACITLLLGVIGVVVPGLPTVPFCCSLPGLPAKAGRA